MGELLNLIKKRRSIRNFRNDKIARDDLAELVEAAIWAPSGGNIQSWRFIIVDDDVLLEKIDAFSPGLSGNPPALIILCYDKNLAYKKGGKFGRDILSRMDISMAAQNIMLLAAEKALASCPVKSFNRGALIELLKLPDKIEPELLISVGYSFVEPPPPKRDKLEEICYFNNWGEENNE
ncbi:nitroreductase family protein [Halanaerobium sp. Z-7514]|uniref:Nitroreductase family protein n=1 Tax=Halanaerobium polyolivorans TaxID=2886943 RepID=A0AAW4X0J2_9FIRM|nr:nitroreductase family protein [Halanaerobium polyolivorans]MCC3145317.1 nitroreductase family protein [Halanaerobium polyolivorans]